MERVRRLRPLAYVIGIVLLIRLPFLNQAIQGDDPKFLAIAQHALIEPAHPTHTTYIFQGEPVDMRGHPHPPGNAWFLAGLIGLLGDVREVPFHFAYAGFSLIAGVSMWFLARRFVPDRALSATLLFLSVPAFVVNGNSLESDVPFLAWWMAGFALFTAGRPLLSVLPFVVAALTSYQAVVATPILLVYCWLHQRGRVAGWAVSFVPVVVVVSYQLWERLTGGTLPAAVLAGYFYSYGLQQLTNKLQNAAALTAHLSWMVFPLAAIAAFTRSRYVLVAGLIAALAGAFLDVHPLFWVSFAVGVVILAAQVRLKPDFLQVWFLLFFAAALVLFFAGSARYLLPLAPPLAMLVAREVSRRIAWPASALSLALGLSLAFVNYQHWDGYRQLTTELARDVSKKRVWVNGEWASFYMESEGALPLSRKQVAQSGQWLVSSELGYPIQLTAPVGRILTREIQPALPLRLIGLGSKSGYSTASLGLRPFDVSFGPIDRVRVEAVLERRPTLSWLPATAPEAETQIVSGVYQAEGQTRWMSGRAVILLKAPAEAMPVQVNLYLPKEAPAKTARIVLDGTEILSQVLPGPGLHELRTRPTIGQTLTISLDKTFSVKGDFRELGAVLVGAGFKSDP
ncbi:MAG: glycosyltransferase family 39 protein [Bryobacteraceae bacterium]|nr:glycosyltransferase family 39 protein [Bryobacteraceae bacterium]